MQVESEMRFCACDKWKETSIGVIKVYWGGEGTQNAFLGKNNRLLPYSIGL